ncbi:MAG: TlpA family protein disulfide reductase [Planctomycetota bacterium]|jgi:hypothetical protein
MERRRLTAWILEGWALVLLLAVSLPLLPLACSSGGEGDEDKPAAAKKEKPKKKKKTPAPKEKVVPPPEALPKEGEGEGGETVEPAPEEPPAAPKTFRLAWRFPEAKRFSYQVRFEFETKKGEQVEESFRVDGTRFVRCATPTDTGFRVVRLEPNPVEAVEGGEPVVRRRAAATAEFLEVAPTGEVLVRESEVRNRLLFSMGEPIFEGREQTLETSWTVERDFEEGRFAFTYQLERETEFEGKPCVAIRFEVNLPGGAPAADFDLTKGEGVIWFDPSEGMVLKAMGDVAFTRGEGEDALASLGTFEITFYDRSNMEPREAVEAKSVLDTYFTTMDMIAKKRYSGAEKAIETFVDKTDVGAYAEIIYGLLKRIPDPRSVQPKGLLDRKREDFRKLPWSRKRGPPLLMMGRGKMVDGKPRTLDVVGEKVPEFWWKKLHKGGKWEDVNKDLAGKVLLIHVWISWVPCVPETLEKTKALAGRFADKGVRLLGITLDTENKDLGAFLKKHPVEHPTVWDFDNLAVKKFKLPGAPAFLVVNRTGEIVFGECGYFGEKTLEKIEETIKGAMK